MKAYSKVNLILKVWPKTKGDVKHRIHSVFCLYKHLYDEITIKIAPQTTVTCEFHQQECKIDKTTTLRAIKFLSNKVNEPIHLDIHIIKNIPIMSGLGGSSTDVAAIMNWIIRKWHIRLDKKDLKDIAINIGSDIPFFLSGINIAEVSGYGEIVNVFKRKIPKFKPIITNIPISTQDVYKAFDKLKKHPK
jgi:4-diphosphocytidyl-2-C-methyl-D-erythritol kinase